VSNLVTISILQSLVVRCLSLLFFKCPSLSHFKSKILKSENENHMSDNMIIGFCEPLVFK